MAEFSASEAALTGFRIVRQRPWIIAVWAALAFLVNLGQSLFATVSAGPAIMKLADMVWQQSPANQAVALGLMQAVAPTVLVLTLIELTHLAVLWAAMNRAVIRPEASRFAYLRLAGSELRQLGLLALLTVLGLAIYFGLLFAAAMLEIAFSLVAGEPAGNALAIGALILALFGALVFFGVRLSLASPMTFVTGRIDLMAAWRMTQGRFWPLLGCYATALALSLVVFVLTSVIALLAVAILGGGLASVGPLMKSDLSSVRAMATPAQILTLAIGAIGAALRAPVILSPPAAVYRALSGTGAGDAGRVFD